MRPPSPVLRTRACRRDQEEARRRQRISARTVRAGNRGARVRRGVPCPLAMRPSVCCGAVLTRDPCSARRSKELDAMLKGDSYWGAPGSAAEVIKAEKKDKKSGAKGAQGAQGAKGVKVGGKKGKGSKNKDPKVLKAQQAAKQLLAAKKVRGCAQSNARAHGGGCFPVRARTPAPRRWPRSPHALASSRLGLT